ncbi:hypothetical protein TNCV_2783071 [Trichonephila clavipes]|nr:hypothetical protein TNCV_2783071 [Trichonephila clavipes]
MAGRDMRELTVSEALEYIRQKPENESEKDNDKEIIFIDDECVPPDEENIHPDEDTAVTLKCLGGLPVDQVRRNALPGSRRIRRYN